MPRRCDTDRLRDVRARSTGRRGTQPATLWRRCAMALTLLLAAAAPVFAKPHEARVPLVDGKVRLADVSVALCRELDVKPLKVLGGEIDLNGLKGATFIDAIDAALGDGCRVTIAPDALVLHVDVERLPKDCTAARKAVRIFTALEAPQATAAQRKLYGLHLPDPLDPHRPMVVLVHGLDSDRAMWSSLTALLNGAGYQVAYFAYPSDGPIQESADFLAKEMTSAERTHPGLRFDVICHSMGGLVGRAYVEGPSYAGGVDHLILCGTPNAGSGWARFRFALELQEHYHLWCHEPGWSPTWMITDGLGEAGDDLKPKSKFLKHLNAQPRRAGVKYTIIAGNQHPATQIEANWAHCTAGWIPNRISNWWGFRQCKKSLLSKADTLRHETGDTDGPVSLKSAKLAGVTDFVVVPADHASLCWGPEPAAWSVIRDRLGK